MSTEAQIAANRANAEQSTGPKTEEGKAASSQNRTSHGLSYVNAYFFLLPWESSFAYEHLLMDFRNEHSPMTRTEDALVERMAQHHWLRGRAEFFESRCFEEDGTVDEKRLALYLRYRTSHERAFHKCFNELLKLRAERRKVRLDEAALSQRAEDSRIGFESQKRVKEEHTRKQEKHEMAKERHTWDILLAEAKVDHQQLRTLNRDMDETEQLIAAEKAKQAA
jgi:hypothetical protein